MRLLVDTSIWYLFARSQRQAPHIDRTLSDKSTKRYLSPISVMEIIQKWRSGKLPIPDPRTWIDEALIGYEILPITEPIARQAALWDWDHKDPGDRIMAATASVHGIELWHNDTVLKTLPGFPQRFFKAPAL